MTRTSTVAPSGNEDVPCGKYNFCRNTNCLINLKKYKYNILISGLVILLIGLNIYFGILAGSNKIEIPKNTVDNTLGMQMVYLKNNISLLSDMINNRVDHEQFLKATNNISSTFHSVSAEVVKQHENFENMSFILNEFDKHKVILEKNISSIFSLLSIFQNFHNKNSDNFNKTLLNYDTKLKNHENSIKNNENNIKNNENTIKNNDVILNKNLSHHKKIILNNTERHFNALAKILELKNNIESQILNINRNNELIVNNLNNQNNTINNQINTIISNKQKLTEHEQQLNTQNIDIEKNKQGYKIYIDSCPEPLKLYTSIGSMFLCYY
tara:strand:+ start:3999 stop:4976 length:978 start_codon:yes stop_codon:yes gene_type:complete